MVYSSVLQPQIFATNAFRTLDHSLFAGVPELGSGGFIPSTSSAQPPTVQAVERPKPAEVVDASAQTTTSGECTQLLTNMNLSIDNVAL